MISAFSLPSHVYLLLAGLLKIIGIFCGGGNKDLLPQFAGPTIKIFLSVPLPMVRSSLVATVKTTGFTIFP